MHTINWRSIKHVTLFCGIVVVWILIKAPAAHAVNCVGATWQFPDQNCGSMAGTFTPRATYTTTELCNKFSLNACMRGQVNQIAMYVPDTLLGTTQHIDIIDGCDDTVTDNQNGRNSRGATSYTYFAVEGPGGALYSDPANPVFSDDPGCPDNGNWRADEGIDFTVGPSLLHDNGYYVYYFMAYGSSYIADGSSWYSNLYTLQVGNPASGITLGVAGSYTGVYVCDTVNKPYSCPTTGIAYSSIAASDNSGVEWNYELGMADVCDGSTGVNGNLILYDADDGIYQFNNTLYLDAFDRLTGAFQGTLTPGGVHVSGGNDVSWPYAFSYGSDQIIRALITNIGEKNSLQLFLSGDANAPNYNCGAPPPPPTDDFTLTAIAQVPAITAGDAEQPQAADFGGSVGFSSTASTVNGVSTNIDTFYNRGGTYDDVAGTLTGGTDTPIGAPNPISNTVNIVSKPTQSLGTINRAVPNSLQLGDLVCTRLTVSPSTGKVDATGTIQPGASGTSTSVRCFPIVNHPYARFYGNDIFAGADFANAAGVCPVGSVATIDVFSHPNGIGGATQFGAMADGSILGLATMSLRDAIGGATDARAFANTGGSAGNFGFSNCADEYATPTGLVQAAGITNGTGAYEIAPAAAGSLGAPFGMPGKLALYYNGDVSITQNIVYSTAGWTAGNIPSLYLIVTGNIYIQPGVTQLDGIYIAKDDGSGTKGRIFTCANGMAAPSNAQMQSGACYANQLVVNGSFIAKHVNLMRTKGSLRGGSSGEQYNSSNIAEVFRFSPEVYMSSPSLVPENTAAGYDSILSLSPTL